MQIKINKLINLKSPLRRNHGENRQVDISDETKLKKTSSECPVCLDVCLLWPTFGYREAS